jgi:EAL and modified HD-GYP domain-containing signal transduction protein
MTLASAGRYADVSETSEPAMSEDRFFLGRQPIIGRQRELVAYELLFRSNNINAAAIIDDVAASAAVIQHAFSDLGMAAALGDKQGFINVSERLLMNEAIEMLPPERIALEILETVRITPAIVARCRQLKELGYRLALDDVIAITPESRSLLPMINVVKVDLLGIREADIPGILTELRPYRVKMLAEKVETQEQYEFCHKMGFDLFQGYFFAKPAMLTGRTVTPLALALLRIFALTAADAELDVLEIALKQAPDLMLRLLKMANARVSPLSRKISSIRNAIMVLGRAQINRFAQIMLFAQHSGANIASDPLVQTAVTRGCFMEGLAIARGWARIKDQAFMVGMFSLVDALFGQPLAEIVALLNLEEDLQNALLKREGRLGTLLRLVEASEGAGGIATISMMGQLNISDLHQFNRVQVEAFKLARQITASARKDAKSGCRHPITRPSVLTRGRSR